jgi:predicted O-methyltransferase YrrM
VVESKIDFNKRIEEIHKKVENVDGFLSKNEGELLYRLALKSKGPIVEIGSYKGKSTIYLAYGSKDSNNQKVYAIDTFEGGVDLETNTYKSFTKNIKNAGIGDIVTPIIGSSDDVAKTWNKEIGLLWIDGSHEYKYVKNDFINWSPHLADFGFIAFHDTTRIGKIGPYKVIIENIIFSDEYSNLKFSDTITYASKKDKNSNKLKTYLKFQIHSRKHKIISLIPKKVKVSMNPLYNKIINK